MAAALSWYSQTQITRGREHLGPANKLTPLTKAFADTLFTLATQGANPADPALRSLQTVLRRTQPTGDQRNLGLVDLGTAAVFANEAPRVNLTPAEVA